MRVYREYRATRKALRPCTRLGDLEPDERRLEHPPVNGGLSTIRVGVPVLNQGSQQDFPSNGLIRFRLADHGDVLAHPTLEMEGEPVVGLDIRDPIAAAPGASQKEILPVELMEIDLYPPFFA